ncbi:MAG: NADH-quinone oxidoreductase subunit J [Bdellovibrionota bacterium]
MTADTFLFWFLAFAIIAGALGVVLMTNPIHSALGLVLTMVSVAAIFVTLQAYFLAGVQLIVYAGAVMVLFVMVLMLFDLKNEIQAFSRGRIRGALKIGSVGILSGLIVGAFAKALIANQALGAKGSLASTASTAVGAIKPLAENLFFNHVFSFELLGVLLLVIAVGTVALSRSKGGTHDRN